LLGGKLMVRGFVRGICDPRRSTMNEQAVHKQRGADIAEIAFYSALVLLVTLLGVYVPA